MAYQYKSLEQRLMEFYGSPLDQTPHMEQSEIHQSECGDEKLPDEDIKYYRELIAEIRV